MTASDNGARPPLMELEAVERHFPNRRGGKKIRAVDGVSIQLAVGETLGLVGESGCGKSTLARLALKLLPVSGGRVRFAGEDVTDLPDRAFRPWRRRMQVIFQDPWSTLNPRMTLAQVFAEIFSTHGIRPPEGVEARTRAILADVGMAGVDLTKRAHEFSGGQLQRIGIGRALALDPEVIVADEPTSALDPSIQAQIINLMLRIRRERGVAFLLISHDLEVVAHLSDRIAVMYLGRIIEEGPAALLVASPAHPYTQALLSAAPGLAETRDALRHQRIRLEGDPPDPAQVPSGCRFHPRCRFVMDRCQADEPVLNQQPDGRRLACHLGLETHARDTPASEVTP